MNETLGNAEAFKDAIWFQGITKEFISIGGIGGIGSWCAFFLARMGAKLILYDFDTIEERNLSGQFFRPQDVGLKKVTASKNIIAEFCNQDVITFDETVNANTPVTAITISAFDNMLARKLMFESWESRLDTFNDTIPIFIDGRLLFEQMQIFCVTKENIDKYKERYLFADYMVEDENCSLKQTTHTAAMIASHMTGFVSNHIENSMEGVKIKEVPFRFEYFVPLNFFENGDK